jgi:hypothetical protein
MSVTPRREDDPPPRDDLLRDVVWSAAFVGVVLVALGLAGWAAPLGR